MKKLSVLLVIGLFCIPMMVYGFTKTSLPSVISNSISKGYHAIVTIASRSQGRSTSLLQPQAENETPSSGNPFFKEPWGAKGIITAIDSEAKSIAVKDAVYFNSALNQFEKSNIVVFVNESTQYNLDLIELISFDQLQVGDLIICSGPSIDHTDNSMKYASDIYKGKFIADNDLCVKSFLGPIHDLNIDTKAFSVDYFAEDGMVYTIRATITPDTHVFTVRKGSTNQIGPEFGFIPSFVKDHDSVSGTFIIKQDFSAEVQLITFYEN